MSTELDKETEDLQVRCEALESERDNIREFLDCIIDQNPFPIWISDDKGLLIRANPSVLKLLNVTSEQIVNKYNILKDPIVARNGLTEHFRRVYEDGVIFSFELDWPGSEISSLDLKDCRSVYIEGTLFPVINKKGKITNAIMTYKEISQLKGTMNELAKAKNYIDNIINSMPSVLVGVDSNYEVTQWNLRAVEITGINSREALGKKIYEIMPQLSDEIDNIQHAIKERRARNRLDVIRKSGIKNVHENITIYPLITNGVEGAVIRVDDVTQQRETERQLIQSRKMDAIGQLAGGVAHDFNNMLCGILGAAEMLDGSVAGKERKYLDIILNSAHHAAELTTKLLAFSRKGQIITSSADVHQIIRDTVDILKLTVSKNIKIKLELDAGFSHTACDESQLQNALMNLGLNAAQAMPNGGELTITTKQTRLDENFSEGDIFPVKPGEYIEIDVRDTGVGIPPDDIEKIFEPFFTTKEHGKGTGLGLAAVYGTIQEHGGAILVDSEVGKGSVFKVFLPVSEKAEEQKTRDEIIIGGTGCILVVDDEQSILMTLEAMLESVNYKVLMAENGQAAIELYREKHNEIDMVLLDMIMPEMNGREVFRRLQEINPEVKVVISSGYTNEEDIGDLFRLGLSDFIRKPYHKSELSRVVARVINSSK